MIAYIWKALLSERVCEHSFTPNLYVSSHKTGFAPCG